MSAIVSSDVHDTAQRPRMDGLVNPVVLPFTVELRHDSAYHEFVYEDAHFRLLDVRVQGIDDSLEASIEAVTVNAGMELLPTPVAVPYTTDDPVALTLKQIASVRSPNALTLTVVPVGDWEPNDSLRIHGEFVIDLLSGGDTLPVQRKAALLPDRPFHVNVGAAQTFLPLEKPVFDHPDAEALAGLEPGMQEPPVDPLEAISRDALKTYRGNVMALLETMTEDNAGQVLGDVTVLSGQYKRILDRFAPSKTRLRKRGRGRRRARRAGREDDGLAARPGRGRRRLGIPVPDELLVWRQPAGGHRSPGRDVRG